MRRTTTLKTRLLLSFIITALVPVAVATGVAVPWFRNAIEGEAQRTLGTHATVETELFAEMLHDSSNRADALANLLKNPVVREAGAIDAEMRRQAAATELTYAFYIDDKGIVRGSTASATGQKVEWKVIDLLSDAGKATSSVEIVPEAQLAKFVDPTIFDLKVKETEGGSAPQKEADGALSIVGVAPVEDESGKPIGTVVGVSVLKKDTTLVDSVVSKVGGVATVFQNGVRVATTVKNDAGERAIGTAISDKVRAACLETGRPYTGEAFVVNKPYFTSYVPMLNSSDEVVGMLFVGIDQAPYKKATTQFAIGMFLVMALGLAIAIGFGFFGSHQLSAPFAAISEAAQRMIGGDLTVSVPEAGFREAATTGVAFNTMTRGIRDLLSSVGGSVKGLESVAGSIASASDIEADSAASQASAVAEATATVEELDRSFVAVAEGAKRVLEIAEDSLEVADNGRDAVQESTGQINRLSNGASATREAADNLALVADDIDQVTFVIGSIAEQTKILALNAAIEAARAGEAGKGFGVVATEIRTLADSVSTSVGRIEELVRTIQGASKELAATAVAQAELGESTVQGSVQTRDKFDEIYERMNRTASAAREIATAAAQQQSAARQIVQVMHQVSEGVSSTAAASRQLAGSAADIKRETTTLSGGLRGFKVD